MIGENVNPTALRCSKPLFHEPVRVSRLRNGWPAAFFRPPAPPIADASETASFGERAAAFLGGPLWPARAGLPAILQPRVSRAPLHAQTRVNAARGPRRSAAPLPSSTTPPWPRVGYHAGAVRL